MAGPSTGELASAASGRGQGHLVVTGRKVERAGEVARLEVVERELSVHVHVDGGVRDAVQHRELRVGGDGCSRGGDGEARERR